MPSELAWCVYRRNAGLYSLWCSIDFAKSQEASGQWTQVEYYSQPDEVAWQRVKADRKGDRR
jgi:hypothetical protein